MVLCDVLRAVYFAGCCISFVTDQEEEFADTGYQVAPADANSGGNRPSAPQLGALTFEDFRRKPEASSNENRLGHERSVTN